MKNLSYISIFVSLLALSVSIGCLCHILPRELGIDYLGWIVGVLALLTTILLGWNIYSIIDIKETQRRYSDIINDVDIASHKVLTLQENVNWMIYHQLLLGKDPIGLEYRLIYHSVACLYHASCINDWGYCSAITKGICENLANPDNIKLKSKNKAEIISLLHKVREKDRINGYNEVLTKILRLQTLD